MLDPYSDKTGYALCTYGLSWGPSSEPILFIGKHDVLLLLSLLSLLIHPKGKIVPKRGPENFGKRTFHEECVNTLFRMGSNL